jgi:hypothetical protein
MIIIYLKDAADVNDCHLHMALPHINSLEEKSGELYAGVRNDPVVSDIARVGWFAVPEQPLPPPSIDNDGMRLRQTVGELNLRYYDSDTLPCSAHYAQLTAVHPGDRLKAEVRRYFMGEWYDGIRCLGSKTAVERYQAGEITLADTSIFDSLDPANKNSWVKVDFITENFDGEKVIPIVMDKVEL